MRRHSSAGEHIQQAKEIIRRIVSSLQRQERPSLNHAVYLTGGNEDRTWLRQPYIELDDKHATSLRTQMPARKAGSSSSALRKTLNHVDRIAQNSCLRLRVAYSVPGKRDRTRLDGLRTCTPISTAARAERVTLAPAWSKPLPGFGSVVVAGATELLDYVDSSVDYQGLIIMSTAQFARSMMLILRRS